ncbi:MAG: hypothetical protein HQM01_09225 [Magnetococcales bacterium]|nr:hypothetical protein [Magnetococcales bacterium]
MFAPSGATGTFLSIVHKLTGNYGKATNADSTSSESRVVMMDEADQAQQIAETGFAMLMLQRARPTQQLNTSGFCRDCNIAIPQARLEANPGAWR